LVNIFLIFLFNFLVLDYQGVERQKLTDFIQEKFPKTPTLKLQINNNNKTTKPQTDSNKKGNFFNFIFLILFFLILFLASITQRPSNLDALIDKKLAEKKASLAAGAASKKVSLTGRK